MNASTLKKAHKWLFWLWVMPGLPISVYLRDSVAWVMVLSIYTILMEHLIGWRQEDEKMTKEVTEIHN